MLMLLCKICDFFLCSLVSRAFLSVVPINYTVIWRGKDDDKFQVKNFFSYSS